MTRIVNVDEVWEENDCAGRKDILVGNQMDEATWKYFVVTRSYLFPQEKIDLVCVTIGDTVSVVDNPWGETGEIVGLDASLGYKDGLCACKTPMTSDGIYVYCSNIHCGLTIHARIKRLANISFFRIEEDTYDPESGLFCSPFNLKRIRTNKDIHFEKPFASLLLGKTWGYDGYALNEILLNKIREDVSIATFLIEPLFKSFVDNGLGARTLNDAAVYNITRFYGNMDQLVNRRDYHQDWQNNLLSNFLWSLGIESLSESHINLMIQYEHSSGLSLDPMLIYAYLLSHPNELMRELGLSYTQTQSIHREVTLRRHELHDIFYHYAQGKTDVTAMFSDTG